jgi:hypothetical protein
MLITASTATRPRCGVASLKAANSRMIPSTISTIAITIVRATAPCNGSATMLKPTMAYRMPTRPMSTRAPIDPLVANAPMICTMPPSTSSQPMKIVVMSVASTTFHRAIAPRMTRTTPNPTNHFQRLRNSASLGSSMKFMPVHLSLEDSGVERTRCR